MRPLKRRGKEGGEQMYSGVLEKFYARVGHVGQVGQLAISEV
jgi:hypothetical protein